MEMDTGTRYTEEQYDKAKLIIAVGRQASVALVQRKVTEGKYIPAALIIDRLEDEGFISGYLGRKPREVYLVYPYDIHNGEGI
jgi:DNA segregation ATPase FtsK/SpoIIIE-like protein